MAVGPPRHAAADSMAAEFSLVQPAPELASLIGMGQQPDRDTPGQKGFPQGA